MDDAIENIHLFILLHSCSAAALLRGTSRWHSGAWCGACRGNGGRGKIRVGIYLACQPREASSLSPFASSREDDGGDAQKGK